MDGILYFISHNCLKETLDQTFVRRDKTSESLVASCADVLVCCSFPGSEYSGHYIELSQTHSVCPCCITGFE